MHLHTFFKTAALFVPFDLDILVFLSNRLAAFIADFISVGTSRFFMKGGNTQARAQKYDEKKMEKVSGICLILIGVATGVDAFTTSVAAKIAYVVILFVILAVFLFVLRTKCIKK